MVKLRLKRIGRKHEPHYRIVAADARFPRDGRGAVDPGKASFVCAPAADKVVLHEAS